MKKRKNSGYSSRINVVEEVISERADMVKSQRIALARAILQRLDEKAHAERRSTVKKLKKESP